MHALVLAVACFAGLFAVTRLMAGWLVHCCPSSPVTCPFCNASPDLLLPLLVGDPADQVWDRFHRGEVMIIDTNSWASVVNGLAIPDEPGGAFVCLRCRNWGTPAMGWNDLPAAFGAEQPHSKPG